MAAPEALLQDGGHLTRAFGAQFVCLVFAAQPNTFDLGTLVAAGVRLVPVSPGSAQAWERYGLGRGVDAALVLVRPDGYVMGRWPSLDGDAVRDAMQTSGVWA